MTNSNENKILHKELSYQLQGLFFAIRNDLGSGHKESIYQKALEKELIKAGIKFVKEPPIKIYSKNKEFLGLYRPDFLVEDRIIVELKAIPRLSKQEAIRIYDYLRNSEYELLYLVNFVCPRLYIKRYLFTNDRKPWLTAIKSLLLFVAISFLFVGIRGGYAAQMFFDATTQVQIGEKFEVKLLVNTEKESINAFEGKVIFSKDVLDLKDIRDGNTIVNFWIERPRIATNQNTNGNEIRFSGIVPGGYNGDQGLLFSVIFEVKKEGPGFIEIQNAKTLLNDGEGTSAQLKTSNFQFVAIREPIRGVSWVSPKDTEPPEPFVPEIAKDETLFEGKWFIIFATQDKSSGIDHYEVREAKQWVRLETLLPFIEYLRHSSWIKAESPYVLKDQELKSFIWIKAVDKAGNERIAELTPRNPLRWYESYENWIMIIIATLIILAAVYIIRKKHAEDRE